jgi:integrative and conjugative element protein (TIGR02256 family)
MSKLIFQNKESTIGIVLPNNIYSQLLDICEASYPLETGGIIIGNYSLDSKWAKITRIVGPQKHSKHNRSSFFRSNYGVKSILDEEWASGNFYLGDWHYHPNYSSSPSHIDIQQMKAFSKNRKLKCPEPILLIIGGKKDNWNINVSVIYDSIVSLDITPT